MCGICGVYGFDDRKLIRAMNKTLVHRGPDQEGYFIDKNIMLGHRRLSIIDLSSKGKQPTHNENKTVWCVYNGEIYNFAEIRDELEKKGHRFYSNTDTEVIVHAYEEYGFECLKYFNGMFAFALWDSKKKLLFLARDRIGVKPLHYYYDKKKFVFASEIKAILADKDIPRKVNHEALSQFIGFEYVPAPLTMFEGIYKLPAAHYLVVKNKKVEVHKYWDVVPQELNGIDLIKTTRNLIHDSVKMRLVSDVPLGAFLSGGIDSSTIVSVMSSLSDNVKTFSIGFNESTYDESKYARLVADKFKTDHTEKIIDPKDIIPLFDKIIPQMDEPFGDLSIFPTYLVSELARTKVTVSLSGDGGDELFGGYDWYLAESLSKIYSKVPLKSLINSGINRIGYTSKSKGFVNKAKRFLEGYNKDEKYSQLRWLSNVDVSDIKNLLSFKFEKDPFSPMFKYSNSGFDGLNKNMYLDLKTYLPDDIFTKVDRASMMVSLEAREPLVDYRLVEHAFRIPSSYKIRGINRKYLMKMMMKDILPKEIIHKEKQGFTIPMKNWMRSELKDFVVNKLSKDNLKEIGLFNQSYIDKVLEEHMSKRKDNQRHIWSLMSFVMWYENYI